jgi:putative acetyltransferase
LVGEHLTAVRIRPYRAEDAAATLRIFERAVMVTARSRYSAEQVEAWVGGPRDVLEWAADRLRASTFVAEVDGSPAGFADLADSGYIDRLFVDPDHNRRGIGTALLARVVEEAKVRGIPRLSTHASLVARSVFERAGFRVVEKETVVKGDIRLDRFFMLADG